MRAIVAAEIVKKGAGAVAAAITTVTCVMSMADTGRSLLPAGMDDAVLQTDPLRQQQSAHQQRGPGGRRSRMGAAGGQGAMQAGH